MRKVNSANPEVFYIQKFKILKRESSFALKNFQFNFDLRKDLFIYYATFLILLRVFIRVYYGIIFASSKRHFEVATQKENAVFLSYI